MMKIKDLPSQFQAIAKELFGSKEITQNAENVLDTAMDFSKGDGQIDSADYERLFLQDPHKTPTNKNLSLNRFLGLADHLKKHNLLQAQVVIPQATSTQTADLMTENNFISIDSLPKPLQDFATRIFKPQTTITPALVARIMNGYSSVQVADSINERDFTHLKIENGEVTDEDKTFFYELAQYLREEKGFANIPATSSQTDLVVSPARPRATSKKEQKIGAAEAPFYKSQSTLPKADTLEQPISSNKEAINYAEAFGIGTPDFTLPETTSEEVSLDPELEKMEKRIRF